jgi:hypothetical protein
MFWKPVSRQLEVQLQFVAPFTAISHSSPADVSSAPLPQESIQLEPEHTFKVPHAPVLFLETHALLLHEPSVQALSKRAHCAAETHSRQVCAEVHTPPEQVAPADCGVYTHWPAVQDLVLQVRSEHSLALAHCTHEPL